MKEQKRLKRWIREHEAELIIAGVSAAMLLAVTVGIRKKEPLKEAWGSLQGVIKKTDLRLPQSTYPEALLKLTVETDAVGAEISRGHIFPFEVREHIRNLPEGWRASPGKIAEAAERGWVLQPGQTWVDKYIKGCSAA